MNVKRIAYVLLLLVGIPVIIIVAAYFVNIRVFSNNLYMTPHEAFFMEGLLLLVFGALFLLGRGGLNIGTLKEVMLAALAEEVTGQETVGPNETMRRERWKPVGYTRFALVLLMTGFLMLVLYFLG